MYGILCHYHQMQEEGLRANAKLSHDGVNSLANTSHQHQANNQWSWEDSQPSTTVKQTRLIRWTMGHKEKAISDTHAQSANFLDEISDPTIWLEVGRQIGEGLGTAIGGFIAGGIEISTLGLGTPVAIIETVGLVNLVIKADCGIFIEA